jgi:hypothetical protein
MYRNTRLRVAAAFAAIICLLFSQLAVAAYACPALLHSAAAATMAQATDRGDNSHDLCTEHDAARPGLCLAHCNPAELSLNHAQVDTPPVMLVALHPLADHCAPAVLVSTAPQLDVPLRSHSPPHSILHCCFRI